MGWFFLWLVVCPCGIVVLDVLWPVGRLGGRWLAPVLAADLPALCGTGLLWPLCGSERGSWVHAQVGASCTVEFCWLFPFRGVATVGLVHFLLDWVPSLAIPAAPTIMMIVIDSMAC